MKDHIVVEAIVKELIMVQVVIYLNKKVTMIIQYVFSEAIVAVVDVVNAAVPDDNEEERMTMLITIKMAMIMNNNNNNNKVVIMRIIPILIDAVIPIVVNVVDGPMRKVQAPNNRMMVLLLMINNKMKIKVRLLSNVNDLIVDVVVILMLVKVVQK